MGLKGVAYLFLALLVWAQVNDALAVFLPPQAPAHAEDDNDYLPTKTTGELEGQFSCRKKLLFVSILNVTATPARLDPANLKLAPGLAPACGGRVHDVILSLRC